MPRRIVANIPTPLSSKVDDIVEKKYLKNYKYPQGNN